MLGTVFMILILLRIIEDNVIFPLIELRKLRFRAKQFSSGEPWKVCGHIFISFPMVCSTNSMWKDWRENKSGEKEAYDEAYCPVLPLS
jgi:hypothetical protein